MAVSRTYQAIRWFALNMECDTTHDYYRDFIDRMAGVVPAATKAYKQLMVASLPFDISDERVADEYRSLKRRQAATAAEPVAPPGVSRDARSAMSL